MEKHFDNIRKLIGESLIVKVVAPSSYGKSTKLPIYLKNFYDVKVIVANENISNSLNRLNNIYISSKNFLKNIKFPELLIIDEMDTGSIENFLIISLWKKAKNNTKLILLSSLDNNLFPEFPTYKITANKKSDIRYISNDLIDLVHKVHNSDVSGDFLIFTIKPYIQEIIENLQNIISNAKFYSSENIDANMYNPTNERKIIVASDLAKTSLSLNSISVIFDTMIERRLVQTITGGAKIRTEYISKRDAELRARNNCIVYRFISEKEYNDLEPFTEEIIFRTPLHHVMLDIYKYNLNPFEVLPDLEKMNFIFNLFHKYGILDFNNKITKKGKLLRKLPFGIRNSLLCLENNSSNISSRNSSNISSRNSYPTVVLASCIENHTKYTIDIETKIDYGVENLKHFQIFEKFRGFTDAETVLNIFTESSEETKETNKNLEEFSENKNLEDWCYNNYIQYDYLKNVYSSVDKVCKILNISPINFNVVDSLLSINDLIEKLYSDRKLFLQTDSTIYTLYTDENNEIYNIDPNAINLISIKRPNVIYGLILSSLEETKSVTFSF